MLGRLPFGLLVATLTASGCHNDAPPPSANGTDASTPTAVALDAAAAADAASVIDAGAASTTTMAAVKALGGAGSFEQQGSHCLADPSCPASEAERLFRQSDDSKEKDADCFRFANGIGVAKDAARGRACLARQLGPTFCKDGPTLLSEATLLLDMIDGIGGPRDVAGARKMLAACPDDITHDEVRKHLDAVDKDPKTPAADACKDVGGTTLFTQDCAAETYSANQARSQLATKQIAAGLDDEGKRLFAAANKAYEDYASAWGNYKYEKYKDGSIRGAVSLGTQNEVLARRSDELAKFSRFTAKPVATATLAKDESDVQAQTKAVAAKEPAAEAKKECLDSESVWATYRDAEVLFYVHAKAAQSPDDVKGTTLAMVYADRKHDLAN